MRRRGVVISAVAAVVVVVVAAIGFVTLRDDGESPAPRRAADAYLGAWSRGDIAAMAAGLDGPPPDLEQTVNSLDRSAPGTTVSANTASVKTSGDQGTATYHARIDVAGFGPFEYDGQLALANVNGQWRVRWSPDALFPGLLAGQRLAVHKTWPARAAILDQRGDALVSDQQGVSVGLEPDRIQDLEQVKSTLSQLLDVDPASVDRALAQPWVQPNLFVPIVTLPNDRYDSLRAQLAPVPGILFQRTPGRFATDNGIAANVVGRVGDITAERLTELGPPYAVGDAVGLSGIEGAYETRLAGRPAGAVDVVDDKGAVVRTAHQFPGTDPQPVQLALDPETQSAAERALQDVAQPAALVALDAATGRLRAVVSTPTDTEFNRAIDGQYPPGSTFKVVTAAALLEHGTTADTDAPCPPSLNIGGRPFTNFEGEAAGSIPFHRAFAISCNTAFIGLAEQLPPDALANAAREFGFGSDFPTPSDDVERAAAAIGQARITASPAHMATVAGTVASGQWRPPVLVLQPADAAPPSLPPAPSPAVLDTLRSMMTEVVASGTGTAAAVSGQPIAGKTGTAEFGTADPPSTHAWFIGFRGNLAFAIVIEDGGVGGEAAAPIAARFLGDVPQ